MHGLLGPENMVDYVAKIPRLLPILPLRNAVAYPFSVMPLVIGVQRSVKLVEDVTRGDHLAGLVAMKDASIEDPQPEQIYLVGTVARIFCVAQASDSTLQIVVHGLERFRIESWSATEPYLKARIALIPDRIEPCVDLEALQRCLRDLAQEVIALSPNLPDEAANLLEQVKDPRHLTYLIAANTPLEVSQGQRILEMDDLRDKLHALIDHLSHEKEVLKLGRKIRSEVHREMGKAQREYYLREQIKAIQKELGETDDVRSVAAEYAEKIEKAGLPEEAKKEAHRELGRLRSMSPQSAEYSVIKTYLDWLVDLPWNVLTEDQLDIKQTRSFMYQDHYDLQEVKDRIIEYLAVRKLARDRGMESESGEEAVSSTAMGATFVLLALPVSAKRAWDRVLPVH